MRAPDRAIVCAREAWEADIVDPPDDGAEHEHSRLWIRRFIGEGLGWTASAAGYIEDGQFAWCGAFVAWCYAGVGLRADIRRTFLASTFRLDTLGRGRPWGKVVPPVTSTHRFVVPLDALPGDVMVVGSGPAGAHIVLVEAVESRTVRTLEGNATGLGPRGNVREGVIRHSRDVGTARFVLRFAPEDYDAEAPDSRAPHG